VVGIADPAQASANFIVFAVIGMLLAAYPAGRMCDRLGRKPIAFASALLGALAILLIIILPKEYNLLLLPAVLLGIALGAFSTTNWAMATDLVPCGEEARYLGIANMATAGGAALARLIGPVIDLFNARAVNLGYQVMLICCLAYFIAGAFLLLKVKSPIRP
jgi:MFS family permease